MGAGIRRLLAAAAALCLTASLTGCFSRLPDPPADGGGSTAAGEGSTTAATEAVPTEPGTDLQSLYDLVRHAVENTPGRWELNAQADVQVSMRGDWGGVGYRYTGPIMTAFSDGKGIHKCYCERNFTYWSAPDSRYHNRNSSDHQTYYCDGIWEYWNINGEKTKNKVLTGEYFTFVRDDFTQPVAPLSFSRWLVKTAEVEGSGGAYLVRMTLDPDASIGYLRFLFDEFGDPGEHIELLSIGLEFLIRPEGYLKSQIITVTARSRQTFGAPEDLLPQEEVEYTAIYAATYAPKEEKPVIVPPSDLDTYREADDNDDNTV